MTTDAVDTRKLTRSAREALSADEETRLRVVRKIPFIKHAAVARIERRLADALVDYPTGGDRHLLIVADSGMGKSMVVKRFYEQHRVPDDPSAPAASVPVLYVSFAIAASPKGFLGRILEKLNAPYSPSSSAEVLYPQVLRQLRRIGLKVLVVDEIHHVLTGPENRQVEALAVLKLLGNDLGITIVGCGVESALKAVQVDEQMQRRFRPIALHRWRFDENLAGFLNAVECALPLAQASNLSDERVASWILAESEGLTGEIVGLVEEAAILAIETGRERIDLATLQDVDWVRPSIRKEKSQAALAAGRPRK